MVRHKENLVHKSTSVWIDDVCIQQGIWIVLTTLYSDLKHNEMSRNKVYFYKSLHVNISKKCAKKPYFYNFATCVDFDMLANCY